MTSNLMAVIALSEALATFLDKLPSGVSKVAVGVAMGHVDPTKKHSDKARAEAVSIYLNSGDPGWLKVDRTFVRKAAVSASPVKKPARPLKPAAVAA